MSAEGGNTYSAKVGPFPDENRRLADASATVRIIVEATDSRGYSAITKTSLTLYDCNLF
jgi:hypothetical protein